MKNTIRLRINRQRIEALHEICDEMLEEFKPENAHHHLLKEYLAELRERLNAMILRDQHLYTLMLTSTEAIAFYQLWNTLDISHDKYAMIIVDGLMKKMGALAA